MSRPKRTRKDANHNEIRQAARQLGYRFIDTSDLPGDNLENPLDAFILNPTVEPAPVIVAYSIDDVVKFFEDNPGVGLVQVEIKASEKSPFTDDEREYLNGFIVS